MPEPKIRLIRAHSGMCLWAFIVGLSFPAVGFLSEGLPPLLLTAIRFAIAFLSIIPLAWKQGDIRTGFRGAPLYFLMGLCLAAFFGIMFWAAHKTTALSMATLYVSVPLLAYLMGRGLGVEPKAGGLLVILSIGAAGALALALAEAGGKLSDLQFGIGEGAFFFGCMASALYPVLSKLGMEKQLISENAAVRTMWSLVSGSLMIGVLGLVFEDPALLKAMTLTDLLLVAYLGIFSSGVTFWLLQGATGLLTPGVVTAYSYLVPSVSMILLFVQQPEQIGLHWLPGCVMVFSAIALLMVRDTKMRVE